MDLTAHIKSACPTDLDTLERMQTELAKQVICEGPPRPPVTIAAIDLAYNETGYCAAASFYNIETRRHEAVQLHTGQHSFLYKSGLFAYRELPGVLDLFETFETRPDLVIFDGNGQLHKRRCGAACYLGLALDIPVIGVSKNPPARNFEVSLGAPRGSMAMIDNADIGRGIALRSRDGVKPIFVSVGHRVTIDDARDLILKLCRYRIPEPLRRADQACRAELKKLGAKTHL